MEKKYLFFLVLIFCFNYVYSQCDENQININEASLEDLQKLQGIGPSKSQGIVDSRPFNNIDELIKVKGIGEVTLENIKNQGIACVEEDKEIEIEEDKEILERNSSKKFEEIKFVNNTAKKVNEEREVIYLSPQNIKSDKQVIFESKNEKIKKYAIYAFALFCVLIIFLLMREK
jgi:competence ComEA-like helix-hairpin-helix protein